ncbi:MAG: homoserine kinase [Bryobacteraceae bacterium]|nr:homoserine kinase [Bryobacteraceae bacterium]
MDPWKHLRVPASSANLGPGFDSLGLALARYLNCRYRPSRTLQIQASGVDAGQIPCDASNLIWQTVLRVGADTGIEPRPIEMEIENGIPLGKGLGSSAAALTAGVVIASDTLELGWKRARILDEAARIEGHPDNVAACVLGSLVTSATSPGGVAHAVRLEISPRFGVAVVIPDFALPTQEARAVLPDFYSREDTVFNVQRSALLIAALATGTVSAFPAALEDRMHQPYRAPLVPGLDEILRLRAPGLLGCALSGAGPSVLVFFERGSESVGELVRRIFAGRGIKAHMDDSGVDCQGYILISAPAGE